MSKGRLICLTGIDGSGKTTLAHGLAEWLGARGQVYRYVYARFLPLLVRPMWVIAKWATRSREEQRPGYADYTARKRSLLRPGIFSHLHEASVLLDYWLQILFKVSLPLGMGRNLICDRYVYDTVVSDLAPDLGYSPERMRMVIDACLAVMPRPDLVFLLDVPEDTTLSRKNDVAAVDYLTERREIYRSLTLREQAVALDGTLPRDRVRDRAGEIVLAHFGEAT
jgi:thymidylate kinase